MIDKKFRFYSDEKTIVEIVGLLKSGHLKLSPGFQRKSVWKISQRRKLIDSIIQGYPLPSIFFYKREERGEIYYDVIDGKQRLESIFFFIGALKRNSYEARVKLPGEENTIQLGWKKIKKMEKQHLINGYKIQTTEVEGGISDVIDLFVRINSTGSALSKSEQRHAKYYNSNFLKKASVLASQLKKNFLKHKILSFTQIDRMKHIELVCEIMLSINSKDVIDRKMAIDKVLEGKNFNEKVLKSVVNKTKFAIKKVYEILPAIKSTRFKKVADFYTLVVLISKFDNEKLVLNHKKRNKLAGDILRIFSTKIDELAELQRKAKSIPSHYEFYRQYFMTIQRGTDQILQRRNREQIIRSMLGTLFIKKDIERLFTSEQRRIIWNSSIDKKCKECGKKVTWEDFTVDHIDPYSKGGRTKLNNAALMCRSCNASKGNKCFKR